MLSRHPRKRVFSPAILRIEDLESRTLLSSLVWAPAPSLPAAVANSAAANWYGEVLVAGGATATSSSSSAVYEFDGTQWLTDTQLTQSLSGAAMGVTGVASPIFTSGGVTQYKYNSDIFVYGGRGGSNPTAATESYVTTDNDSAGTPPSMSVARYDMAYAADPATGDLYAIGGLGTSNKALSSVEYYDPVADTWNTVASLPQAVYSATAASDGVGHIFVFGGDNASGQPLSTVYRYTIATNTWDTASDMPVAASGASAVYASYGMIYVIGGLSSSGALSSVNVYDPVIDQWSTETSLPNAVYDAAVVIDGSGNVDVAGGYNAAGIPVADVFTSPVGPAPTGLPATPTLVVGNNGAYFNGAPQPLPLAALGTDGQTPVDGTLVVTYNGSTTPPTVPGSYKVVAVFTSNDPNYTDTASYGTFVIDPAPPTITVTGGGTFTYNGQAHPITATVVGIDGVTPVSGTIAYTYNGSATPPVNGGTYTAVATFTSSDPDYANATAQTTITIPDPTIPTGVTVTGISTSAMLVSWNTAPIAVAYYNLYKQYVYHSPRGSGGGVGYTLIASHITATSAVVSGTSGTYAVTSVSPTGVESARSAIVRGSALYAPTLWGADTLSGADVSSLPVTVGQTVQIHLLAYGNEAPTYSVVSGPSGVSVDPITGIVTYVPAGADVGNQIVTFKATNSVGTSTNTFTFVVSAPAGVSAAPGSQYYLTGAAGAQTLDVAAGNVTLSSDLGGNFPGIGLTIENGALVTLASSQTLSQLLLNGNGTLDVATNSVIVNYGTNPDPAAAVLQALQTGSNGGAWNGTGIISSAAAGTGKYGVGFGDGADGVATGLVAGQIKLMFTLNGDANLDGAVNGADFGILAANFNRAAPQGWEQGDFNYDGAVNGADFAALSANFNQGLGTPAVTLATTAATTATSSLSSATSGAPLHSKHSHSKG